MQRQLLGFDMRNPKRVNAQLKIKTAIVLNLWWVRVES